MNDFCKITKDNGKIILYYIIVHIRAMEDLTKSFEILMYASLQIGVKQICGVSKLDCTCHSSKDS